MVDASYSSSITRAVLVVLHYNLIYPGRTAARPLIPGGFGRTMNFYYGFAHFDAGYGAAPRTYACLLVLLHLVGLPCGYARLPQRHPCYASPPPVYRYARPTRCRDPRVLHMPPLPLHGCTFAHSGWTATACRRFVCVLRVVPPVAGALRCIAPFL